MKRYPKPFYIPESSLRAWELFAEGQREREGAYGTANCALLTLIDAYRWAKLRSDGVNPWRAVLSMKGAQE